MEQLPSRPSASSPWFEQLRRLAGQAAQAGAKDEDLAYDLMSLRAGFGIPERSAPYADLLWALAWHLGLRAPAVSVKWLVSASLELDKVHWGQCSVTQLIEKLEAQESHLEDAVEWLRSGAQDAQLKPLCELASGAQRLLDLSGESLEEAVRQDLAEALRIIDEGGLFERAIELFPMRRS